MKSKTVKVRPFLRFVRFEPSFYKGSTLTQNKIRTCTLKTKTVVEEKLFFTFFGVGVNICKQKHCNRKKQKHNRNIKNDLIANLFCKHDVIFLFPKEKVKSKLVL